MQGNVGPQDAAAAEPVLCWFIVSHRPQLVIVTSRFAGRYAEGIVRGYGIPFVSNAHPGRARNRIPPVGDERRQALLILNAMERRAWSRSAGVAGGSRPRRR